jgi:hypothetical protein
VTRCGLSTRRWTSRCGEAARDAGTFLARADGRGAGGAGGHAVGSDARECAGGCPPGRRPVGGRHPGRDRWGCPATGRARAAGRWAAGGRRAGATGAGGRDTDRFGGALRAGHGRTDWEPSDHGDRVCAVHAGSGGVGRGAHRGDGHARGVDAAGAGGRDGDATVVPSGRVRGAAEAGPGRLPRFPRTGARADRGVGAYRRATCTP